MAELADKWPEAPVIRALRAYQAQLASGEGEATGRLIEAYRRAWERLAAMLEGLLGEISQQTSAISGGQLAKMRRYQELLRLLTLELSGLQAMTTNEVERLAELGVSLGAQSVGGLVSSIAIGDTSLAAGFNALPVGAIKALLGFLRPGSALYQRLAMMTPYATEAVSRAIIQGIALGWNPRKVAAAVQAAFGKGLTEALRFTRTAQLWAYREASRANMLANGNVLDGWVWFAELGDPRTCASCIVMHGTVHPLEERLNDHHCGRCTAIPLVKGFENPVAETGVEWFGRQDEATQLAALGPGKYEAWKARQIGLEQLTAIQVDDVYGEMRVEASLKSLIH